MERYYSRWLRPSLVFTGVLLITVVASTQLWRMATREDQLRFENSAAAIRNALHDRLETYVALIRGTSGVFATSDNISSQSFRSYVNRLRLKEYYPGVQGLGFATRLHPQERDAFAARLRSEGFEGFQIRPAGDRPEYFVITYLEPLDRRNLAALGFDMYSEPVRQEAMKRAVQTGSPVASGRVTLEQEIEPQKQAGFLIYAPVYQGGLVPETEAERWQRLKGFAFSPFRADDLLRGVLFKQGENEATDLDFEVYDGESTSDRLLYRSSPEDLPRHQFTKTSRLNVAGRDWTLRFATRPEFEQASNRKLAVYVFAGGLLIALILFSLVRAQTRARREIGAATSELERSQLALSESEERYRTITETASDAIVTIDERGMILFVNAAAEIVFGYEVAEMMSQPLNMLMPDYQRHLHEAELKRHNQTGQRHLSRESIEVPGLHKDGREIPLEVSFGEFSRKGRAYFTGVIRDVTERKLAERALAERTRLTAMNAEVNAALTQSETLPDCLRMCTDALVRHLDAAFARIWTLNETENMLELQASSGLYTHINGAHASVPVGQFKIGLIAQERLPHLTNDVLNDPRVGNPEWARREGMVAFAGYPLIIDDRLVGVMALFARQALTDETLRAMGSVADGIALGIKRKQNEAELRASEERLRAMVNSVSQLAWMAEPDGRVFWYNQRWYEYTGTTPEQMEGSGWRSVHDPRILADVVEKWTASIRTGSPFEMEYPLRGADGSFRWFLTRAVPLRDALGYVVRWFGTNTDVDELRKTQEALRDARDQLEARVIERTRQLADANAGLLEQIRQRIKAEDAMQLLNQELQRSNRELQDFAFVASHDLQEPLRKIQAFGDLLLNQYGDQLGEEGQDFLLRMQKASHRMHTLINDLLAFSRVTTKAQPFVPVDLNRVAAEVMEDLETRLKQSGGKVEVSPLPTLEADPLQMRQLLQNLLGNALKFHGPEIKPIVHLSAEAVDGNQAELRVKDNGIGFDEKYLDRIFTPFQRLHARNQYEGTGMGLAICRKIVERHGGQITAHSRIGEGTTFLITLPLSHEKIESSPATKNGRLDATPG